MNKALLLGSALTLGLGGVVTGAVTEPPAASAEDQVTWLNSYAAAQAAARQAGKPIFLVFR
ncbi:MAG: hypothetical protein ACK47B_24795 [Armatimonadota bacterium]